jgi:hypothetical protein
MPAKSITLRTACVLFFTFTAVYQVSLVGDLVAWPSPELGDTPPARSLRLDTLFDSDTPHILGDIVYAETSYKAKRHPLFLLYARTPSQILVSLGLSPMRSVLLVTSTWAALSVALAFLAFLRLGLSLGAATAFSVVLGFSPALWLLASVPETFGYNVAAIVLAFLLVNPKLAEPRRYPKRFALFALYAVLAVGATLPNALYVAASFATSLLLAKTPLRHRIVSGLAMITAFAVLATAALWIQEGIHPDAKDHLAFAPNDHLKPRVIRFDRGWQPEYFAAQVRTFLADSLMGRDPEMKLVRTTWGRADLIQFEQGSRLYWVGIAAVGIFFVTSMLSGFMFGAPEGSEAAEQPVADALPQWPLIMAGFLILFNLVFHYFYRSHGQPLIYSTHTLFPILVVLSRAAIPGLKVPSIRMLGFMAFALVIANNAAVVGQVQELLHRPCERWKPRVQWTTPKHPLCARWGPLETKGSQVWREAESDYATAPNADGPLSIARPF